MKGKFPNNLAAAMQREGVGPSELERQSGVSKQNIQRFRDGERRLTIEWAAKLARPLSTTPEQLIVTPTEARIVGRVGANPEGNVFYANGHWTGDSAPLPPEGSAQSVALEVIGHSMRGLADDGSLIYYEERRDPPADDMLGHPVVVEVDTGEVMIKRLLRGSSPGFYDLESINGPRREDARVIWAAHITAIIPPWKARRIIRRGDGL